MTDHQAIVSARWCEASRVWVATSGDIPGLIVIAPDKQDLVHEVRLSAPDLVRASGSEPSPDRIVIHYVDRGEIDLRANDNRVASSGGPLFGRFGAPAGARIVETVGAD